MTLVTPPRMSLAIPLGLLAGLGPLCIDLYLPALPQLALDLQVTTANAQLSLTAGLLGLGIGQLIFGSLSDKYGRTVPLMCSLLLLSLASIGCASAHRLDLLLLMRFFQGIGGAGGAVLSRAIARDHFFGHALTQFFAMLMLVNGVAPIVAPVLGGLLMSLMGWRGIFLVLAAIAIILLGVSRDKISESLPLEKRSKGSFFSAFVQPFKVIAERSFMGFCLTQGFMMAGMFAYIGASPFVLQQIYHVSPLTFSLCFALNGVGLVIASQISARLSVIFSEYRILKCGLIIAFLAALSLVLSGFLHARLAWVLVALFFSVSSNAIISTTAGSLAMQSQGQRAGSASAVIGVTMFGLGSLAIPVTGIGGTSMNSMSATILGCVISAMIMCWFAVKTPNC